VFVIMVPGIEWPILILFIVRSKSLSNIEFKISQISSSHIFDLGLINW
jgi:hypothetical protein